MRRFDTRKKTSRGSTHHNPSWDRYRNVLMWLLIWWMIGAGIGLLFAIALDGHMKQVLAKHLEQGLSKLIEKNSSSITYFLKRCLTYVQLLLMVWGLECWTYGSVGVRLILWGRGFIYGFSQTAWAISYGLKGVFLGMISYIPHNFLFAIVCAWVEWWLKRSGNGKKISIKLLLLWLLATVPVIAWVEVFWVPCIVKACM